MSKTFLLSNETWKQNEEDLQDALEDGRQIRGSGLKHALPKPVPPQTCDANVVKESKMERIAKNMPQS